MHHVTRCTSQSGIDLIKRYEGFSSVAYHCPAGYPTIGYGHLIREGEDWCGAEITLDEAEVLLRKDVRASEKAVLRLICVPLSEGQFDALVSFTFNLGSGALQRSTLRRKLNRREYQLVPDEFRRWVWSGGVKFLGLIRRRNEEAKHFSRNGFAQ